MRLFTRTAFVAGTVLASVGLTSGAWAFFTAAGTAEGAVRVGTVAPPTNVTATQTAPGTGIIDVQWTPPAAPAGQPLKGFYVERLLGPTASPACASSPAALLAPGLSGCSDVGVAPGSYEYRVTAVYRTLTATSTPVTAIVDGLPPTLPLEGSENV